MSESPDCAFCGEPLDGHEDASDCPATEGESDEWTGREIREDMAAELAGAHAAAVVYVRFPREDNDLDDLDTASGRFALDDLTDTETVAAHALLSRALDGMADEADSLGRGRDEPHGMAVAVPSGLGAMLGGMSGDGDDDGPDGRGFA